MTKPKFSVVLLWLSQFFGHGGSSASSRLRVPGYKLKVKFEHPTGVDEAMRHYVSTSDSGRMLCKGHRPAGPWPGTGYGYLVTIHQFTPTVHELRQAQPEQLPTVSQPTQKLT